VRITAASRFWERRASLGPGAWRLADVAAVRIQPPPAKTDVRMARMRPRVYAPVLPNPPTRSVVT
jgi:hypothetical protein